MIKMDTHSSDEASSESFFCESNARSSQSIYFQGAKDTGNTAEVSANFSLLCLQKLNENTSGLKNYTQMLNKFNGSVVTQSSTSNFISWLEEFTKMKHHKSDTEAEFHRDDVLFDNWFEQNTDGSSWLCGSSPPAQLKIEAEDIKVPSIYDSKPAPKGRRALKRERRAERAKDLGKKWFGMKAPDVDEKLKNDMDLIRMRSVLDPKRFYKHNDRKALPKYFQMGTVVDEGTDFYSNRLSKKQRKQTLVEELMADANIRQYNKKKYAELQQKMRGKKKLKKKHSNDSKS